MALPDSRIEQYYDKRQLRQYVLGFLGIFANININQVDKPEIDAPNFMHVPVKFIGANRLYAKMLQTDSRQTILPVISIEMAGFNYGDVDRRVTKHDYYTIPIEVDEKGNVTKVKQINTFYNAPYKINWGVYLWTSTYRDMYILLEQILPVFNPEYYINVNGYYARTTMGTPSDQSDKIQSGADDKDRMLVYQITFETQAFLQKFDKEQGTVRVVDTEVYNGDINITGKLSEILVDENGEEILI